MLAIRTYPDPVLTTPAEPIEDVADEHRRLADEMLETSVYYHGVGLAANQVGSLERLIVVSVGEETYAMANPVIVVTSEETIQEKEGCLSVPGILTPIDRSSFVRVKGTDVHTGTPTIRDAEGPHARVVLHEVDHLNGTLIIDHAGRAKRRQLLKQYQRGLS